jgi:hypothetical protein
MTMRNKMFQIAVVLWVSLSCMVFRASAQSMHMKPDEKHLFISPSAVELRIKLRELWEDHALYTRNVILNVIDDLPGTNESVARLLRNQDDIGNLIKPVYGEDAGNKLAKLLREHIVLAADLLKAAKANNDKEFSAVNAKWFTNADDISAFLSTANPQHWKLEDMKKMMHEHLKLTTDEAVARKNKDYKGDIEAYDKTRAELLEMSDMLAAGIIRQFPDKFKN